MECRFVIDVNKPWSVKPEVTWQLISFLVHNQLDGVELMEYSGKQFTKNVAAFCDGNNKMKGPALRMLRVLRAIDRVQMRRFKQGLGIEVDSDEDNYEVCLGCHDRS